MRFTPSRAGAVLFAALAMAPAATARAHHRQTPPIVAIGGSGETTLPRFPPPGRKAIVVVTDGGATVAVVRPFGFGDAPALVFQGGANDEPVISTGGRTVAWTTDADPLASGAPGTQVVVATRDRVLQAAVDPTGTSGHVALDPAGIAVAFDSTGDLAGTGSSGTRDVFFARIGAMGVEPLRRLSVGSGAGGRPTLGPLARTAAFESSSDPATGVDTGISQIWVADVVAGTASARTAGAAPSQSPCLSDDGRVLVFASRADLLGDGHDTGVSQVFALDLRTNGFARVTDDPSGCVEPTVLRVKRDWRIGYRCGTDVFFTTLTANVRARVDAGGDPDAHLLPLTDDHFVLLGTTADLLGGGGPATPRVYLVNLFKRPPEESPGTVVWSQP